ncbi:MAG: septum site-determining protein MinD [Clostridia bacterium]|nr:septum site-determining protein MinD [Clostridia bacterium]
MGKIILIASGKGGTGKTTLAANLSIELSKLGHLSVAVDMDMGLRNLDIALGVESSIVYDILDVVSGRVDLDDALIKHIRYSNLYVLSSPQGNADKEELDNEKLTEVFQTLKSRFEYCIIDAPAGLDKGFLYSLSVCDEVILVTTPDVSALRDADRVVSVVEETNGKTVRLIVNKIYPELIEKGVMMNVDDCVDMIGISPIGLIPYDVDLFKLALSQDVAVDNPNSEAGAAISNIARRITGEEVPVMDFKPQKKTFFIKLKELFSD